MPVNAAGFEGEREEGGRKRGSKMAERRRKSARIDADVPEDRVLDPDADAVFHAPRSINVFILYPLPFHLSTGVLLLRPVDTRQEEGDLFFGGKKITAEKWGEKVVSPSLWLGKCTYTLEE